MSEGEKTLTRGLKIESARTIPRTTAESVTIATEGSDLACAMSVLMVVRWAVLGAPPSVTTRLGLLLRFQACALP